MNGYDPFFDVKKPRFGMTTVFFVLAVFVVFFVGFEVGSRYSGISDEQAVATTPLDFRMLYKVKADIEDKFLYDDKIDDETMMRGAISGLAASLGDYYTTYFPPEEAEEFRDFLYSELEGIGAELTIDRDGYITVVSPLKGSPAEIKGILPKDIILEIDGEPAGSELFDAVKRIKGPKGTEVCLTILHKDADDTEEICIVRELINVPAVEWEEKENGLYVVALRMFDDSAQKELKAELEKIQIKNPRGIVFDLRYNGGGFLTEATRVASLFLPAGKKVTKVESRNGEGSHSEYTRGKPIFHKLPMVVLVNEGSASASEILAAALRYYAGAKLVGEKTFGKGTAQEVLDYSDGGLLRVTIAKWLTPDGKALEEGIDPDILVKNDPETEEDEQLTEALRVLGDIAE